MPQSVKQLLPSGDKEGQYYKYLWLHRIITCIQTLNFEGALHPVWMISQHDVIFVPFKT